MAFTLITDDGAPTAYDDDAQYSFNKQGLLVVQTGDGRQLTFSPTAWRCLEEQRPKYSSYS